LYLTTASVDPVLEKLFSQYAQETKNAYVQYSKNRNQMSENECQAVLKALEMAGIESRHYKNILFPKYA
jgi:hypothetical protein